MQNFKPFAKFQVSTFFPVVLVAKAIQVLHFIVDFVVLKVVVSHDSQTITEFSEKKGFMTFSPSYPIHYVLCTVSVFMQKSFFRNNWAFKPY